MLRVSKCSVNKDVEIYVNKYVNESVNVMIDFVFDTIACITQSPSNERERERKDRKRTSLVRWPKFTCLLFQHLMLIAYS